MWLSGLTKYRDFGILLLRVGVGVMFMAHGWPKLTAGPGTWLDLGKNLTIIGLDVGPVGFKVFGFLAMAAELGGGFLVLIGLLFRPALLMLLATMAMALTMHIHGGDGFARWNPAAEAATIFLALMFIGPGRFSVDRN